MSTKGKIFINTAIALAACMALFAASDGRAQTGIPPLPPAPGVTGPVPPSLVPILAALSPLKPPIILVAKRNEACGPNLQGQCLPWLSSGASNVAAGGPDVCQTNPGFVCGVCQNDMKTNIHTVCDMPQNNVFNKLAQVNGALGAPCNAALNGVCVTHSSKRLPSDLSPDGRVLCQAHLVCGSKAALNASAAGY